MLKIDLNTKLDFVGIDWTMGVGGSSDGILSKTIVDTKNGKMFLKLSSFSTPFGFYGIEPVVELINSRIGQILHVPVLEYDLKFASIVLENVKYDTLVSVSKDFRGSGVRASSFDTFYVNTCYSTEGTLDFAARYGLTKAIYKEFLFDYLICNLDRHGKNTEILTTVNNCCLAPFFDNSLTFISNRPANELKSKPYFNDMLRVNNFIGEQNLLQNLFKINEHITVRTPRPEDRQFVFQGLGKCTTKDYRDFVWETLIRRTEDVKTKKIPYIQWF